MRTTALRLRILTLMLGAVVVLLVWIPQVATPSTAEGTLTIHFLDVGQGDATFIETPDGVQVLIDGGRDRAVLRELGDVMGLFDRSIDLVIATHPDVDHIGGLVDVLARYEVGSIMQTTNEHETSATAAFSVAVAAENAAAHQPHAGEVIHLGASTTLTVLFPNVDVTDLESNASSVILQLRYGTTEVLLTGDAPDHIETYLAGAYGAGLQSDILKVGHHGSKTSTAPEFLGAVDPTYAVISAGADNPYGHPHAEVMQRLKKVNLEILQTATDGTVTFVTDGQQLWQP